MIKLVYTLLTMLIVITGSAQSLDTIYYFETYDISYKIKGNEIENLNSKEKFSTKQKANFRHFKINRYSPDSPDIIYIDLYSKDSLYTVSLWDLTLKSCKPYIRTKPFKKVLPPSMECDYRPFRFEYRVQNAYGYNLTKTILFDMDGLPATAVSKVESIYKKQDTLHNSVYELVENDEFPHVVYNGTAYLSNQYKSIAHFHHDLFIVSDENGLKFGVIDIKGNILIPIVWNALVAIENTPILFGYKGKVIQEALCEIPNFDENGDIFDYQYSDIPTYSTNWFLLDEEGNETPLQFD